ncbi:MAG TPA: M42 family metallopeptidase [Limnochordales bacterium]|nr:M42 family metallopeptidase [Limnochordales bacterium]
MILRELSELPGVSGDEHRVRARLWEAVRDRVDGGRVDALGNLITWKGADRPGPKVMIAAHMDEIGLMITRIDKDGLLRFRKVGGIDDRVLAAKAVRVGPDGIPGVIGLKPIHLLKDNEAKKAVSHEELYIDIGAASKEEAERVVRPGMYATFATAFGELGDGLVKGKAFDDRAGCALLVELLALDFPFPVYGVFTVQEEIGLRGARVAAYDVAPGLALVLEGTTCADTPGTDPHGQSTLLGHGPAITVMDATHIPARPLVDGLVAAAESAGIPWQWKRTTFGGTDAGSIHLTRAGVPAATVSVPCRYIHSPCAFMSLRDFENTRRLLAAFLEDVPRVAERLAQGSA